MAFLQSREEIPPAGWSYWWAKYHEWAAWYSGDPEQLLDFYTKMATGNDTAQERFWARQERNDRKGIVHMPIAGDIATTGADLLFSEPARLKYDEATRSGERIKEFIKKNMLNSKLLEAAELGGALSGCILKLDVESELEGIPLLNIITPTQFIPTFWRGRLWEILFFRTVRQEHEGTNYRLFENRKREGKSLIIEYQLRKGTDSKVGEEIELNSIDETKDLNLEPVIYRNVEGLGCIYVPNKLPNKLAPGSYLGINDYSQCITMMDSLDFTWTSWMRDIELGMAQIFVDEELMQKEVTDVNGNTDFFSKFSKFTKAFTKINLTQWRMSGESGAKPIDSVQFAIRTDDHMKTCTELLLEIVNMAGYSPQTFGLGEFGNAQSGTALKIREHKSQKTRNKKAEYWKPAIMELLKQMQNIDKASGLSTNYETEEATVELEDGILNDINETSETIRNLSQARAISIYMKVKLLHPDWDDEKIKEETDRINEDEGITNEKILDNEIILDNIAKDENKNDEEDKEDEEKENNNENNNNNIKK
jgi:A118 family predicted phage portal protein